MDRTRLIPPDPMEAAQAPIEGVDVPAEPSDREQNQDQKQYAENEGLANTSRP